MVRILKRKKAKIQKPISQHPREYIEDILNLVVYQLYGIDYQTHVTHPLKPLNVKTDKKVDYVFTCYELANSIARPPEQISKEITAQLIKWIEKKKQKNAQNVTLEAVKGYINFELSEQYLSEAAYYVAHWLQKPQERSKKNLRIRILVEGPVLGASPERKDVNDSFYFVKELYKSAGYSVVSKYLISDASEDAAREATPGLMGGFSFKLTPKGHNKELAGAQYERKVRYAMSNMALNGSDQELKTRIEKLQKKYFEQCQKELKDSLLDPEDLLAESVLTKKVHDWLDGSARKYSHMTYDQNDKSVYYHIPLGPMASLRTANGSLFRAAFLLYNLDLILNDTKRHRDLLVAIIPKKYHQLLYGYADTLAANISYKTFICIDPELVHAALPARSKKGGVLGVASQKMAHSLAGAIHTSAHKGEARSTLLSLVDFPVELNELARQVRILEIMSLIHSNVTNADDLLASRMSS